jgi:hypothetical protein
VKDLTKLMALVGVSTYGGKRGLDACLPDDVAKTAGLDQHSMGLAVAVLLAHAAGVAAALIVLRRQNRRKGGLAGLLRRGPR